MGELKTVLIRVSYLVELPQEEIGKDYGILEKATHQLSEDRRFRDENEEITLKWTQTSEIVLDSTHFNISKCSKCGCWVTDITKPRTVVGLSGGPS